MQAARKKVHFVGSYHDGLPGFNESNHEGHSGWRIDQISDGASAWVQTANPDIILLLIGTNDCIQNHDLSHAMDRMDGLLKNIQSSAPKAQIYISTTIPNANADVQARVLTYNHDLSQWYSINKRPTQGSTLSTCIQTQNFRYLT